MNMHIPFAADRTLLPRSLIKRPRRTYSARYTFNIGQLVTFADLTWTVVNRSPTTNGHQIYSLFRPGDIRPLRVALGRALAAAPSNPAEAERLYNLYLAGLRKQRREDRIRSLLADQRGSAGA
ncbi:hypothetical protein NOI24_08430 [Neorhizobium galegae]|uniref:hypothetical protein n=1 Tax=Neorhizobium galegae TaxID=399 RepID=UPI002107E975|nr:hypothetical protein [Neorhizobium galegae]MCQ1771323.1 hypothetical protein [Neorhizobium galegae]MCQ1800308.1 hypothetical protein [Neorhizobium galegae]